MHSNRKGFTATYIIFQLDLEVCQICPFLYRSIPLLLYFRSATLHNGVDYVFLLCRCFVDNHLIKGRVNFAKSERDCQEVYPAGVYLGRGPGSSHHPQKQRCILTGPHAGNPSSETEVYTHGTTRRYSSPDTDTRPHAGFLPQIHRCILMGPYC
jgi:hypothetical protein